MSLLRVGIIICGIGVLSMLASTLLHHFIPPESVWTNEDEQRHAIASADYKRKRYALVSVAKEKQDAVMQEELKLAQEKYEYENEIRNSQIELIDRWRNRLRWGGTILAVIGAIAYKAGKDGSN